MNDLKYLSSNENIKKEWAEYFNSITKKIKDGYEIISSEEDGCDEYGYMYWVDCKNGWNGRKHELKSKYTSEIYQTIKYLCSKQISIYCKKVYVDDNILLICKNLIKLNKEHINILSEEEFLEKEYEVLLLNKIKNFLIDIKTTSIKYHLQYKYPIEDILTSNINNFINYINLNTYSYSLKEFITKGLDSFISKNKDISKDDTNKILYILDNLNKTV